MVLKFDIIETWYYRNQDEARENDTNNAVGYAKVVDSTLKEHWGVFTDYIYLKSETEVYDGKPPVKKEVTVKNKKKIVFTPPEPEKPDITPINFESVPQMKTEVTSHTNIANWEQIESKEKEEPILLIEELLKIK